MMYNNNSWFDKFNSEYFSFIQKFHNSSMPDRKEEEVAKIMNDCVTKINNNFGELYWDNFAALQKFFMKSSSSEEMKDRYNSAHKYLLEHMSSCNSFSSEAFEILLEGLNKMYSVASECYASTDTSDVKKHNFS